MDPVRWLERPRLDAPVLVAAFEGWNDAAGAASTAARYLAAAWDARKVATIDPEEFQDFTVTRPRVRLVAGTRRIEWPEGVLEVATPPGAPRDVVFLHAAEPQLRWRAYAATVVDLARSLDVGLVVTVGALLADVPHTQPVMVMGTAADPDVVTRLGLKTSRYEGPTGIVGVLHDAFREAGIDSASLWASVPHYVSGTPSPRAALALVESAARLLGGSVETVELEIACAAYDRQVEEAVAEDEDLEAYVHQLEQAAGDADEGDELQWPPAGNLAAEVERFLRGHRPD